jgi:hypothetical protein
MNTRPIAKVTRLFRLTGRNEGSGMGAIAERLGAVSDRDSGLENGLLLPLLRHYIPGVRPAGEDQGLTAGDSMAMPRARIAR